MVAVTMRSDVSVGRKIFSPRLNSQQNTEIYGDEYAPIGLGHNLRFEATIAGEPNQKTGLIMRYDDLQAGLKSVTDELDHQLLNDVLADIVPTLENVGKWAFAKLQKKLPVVRLRVFEGTKTWIDIILNQLPCLTHEWKINCVHRHHNSDLSEDENKNLYGKCAAIHGHEYRIQVTVQAPLDATTGVLIPRRRFFRTVDEHLVQPFDGNFLNDLLGNTSGEIIAIRFTEILRPHLPELMTVTIRETRKNSFFAVPENHSANVWAIL